MESILVESKYRRHPFSRMTHCCSVFAHVTSNLPHFSIYALVSSSEQCACNPAWIGTSITIYVLSGMNDMLLPPIIYSCTVLMEVEDQSQTIITWPREFFAQINFIRFKRVWKMVIDLSLSG